MRKNIKEYSLFLVLAFVLFALKGYDRFTGTFRIYEFVFILNSLWVSLIICYWLLPSYLYRNREIQFIIYSSFFLIISFLLDELLFEKIFHASTKGAYFNLASIIEPITNISVFVGYKLAWDSMQKDKKIAKLNKLLAESQLQHLRSQINPHFLFNILNNLYSYSLENSEKTSQIILKLSSLLRYMLYKCNTNMVQLTNEINFLKSYIELCNIQLEERGEINIVYDKFPNKILIAPLILMVFVENAFKHSTSSMAKNILIKISVINEGDYLLFTCENNFYEQSNKIGLDPGIGLKNVKERLYLAYENRYSLQTKMKEGIYTVSLKLPKQ